jgi:hypothetical protein
LVPSTPAVAASAILAVLVQVYAGATLRGLYADGAHYAVQLAAHAAIPEHLARITSQAVVQWPVVVAMHLGVQTPHNVALVFSLVTNLLPGLIVLLCLPALPAEERHFFIFPAFVYFAGTLSAQFASVSEGLVATSYFWLLLCLIAFGRLTILRLLLIVVLAVGILDLHEQMCLLGPVLFVSCAIRWRGETRLLARVVLAQAAACALAGAVIGAYFVLEPVSVADRNSFISDFLLLRWLYLPSSGLNLPCVLGILAALVLTMTRPGHEARATFIFAVISISLALSVFWLDWLIAPSTQFAARYNGALMSVPLAILLLVARVHKPVADVLTAAPARGIIAILGLSVSLWHVGASGQWTVFLTHFSNALQSHDGIIAWESVIAPPASHQAALSRRMLWPWTNPDLSLVALRRPCVNSIIAHPTTWAGWTPYDPASVTTMPVIQGVTYTYLLPSGQESAACFGM